MTQPPHVFRKLINYLVALLNKHFPILILMGLPVGYFIQGIAGFLQPYIPYLLMTVLYVSFLRMTWGKLGQEIRNIKMTGIYLIAVLFIRPIIFFALLKALSPHLLNEAWPITAILLFGAPTGAFAPTLTAIYNGVFERTLINVVISSFLAAFTIPLLLFLLAGESIDIDYPSMFGFLAMLICLPFSFAMITKKVVPKFGELLAPSLAPISSLCLFSVVIGAMSGAPSQVDGNYGLLMEGALVTTALFALSFVVGWVSPGLSQHSAHEDRVTLAITLTWMNNGIAIVLANKFFHDTMPIVVLFCALSEFPWASFMTPANYWLKRQARKAAL